MTISHREVRRHPLWREEMTSGAARRSAVPRGPTLVFLTAVVIIVMAAVAFVVLGR